MSGLVHVVDERVHEGDQVGRIEFEHVKVAAEPAFAIDHVSDDSMRVFAVFGPSELVPELLGELPGRVFGLTRARRQEGPVRGVEPVSRPIGLEDLGRVARRVGGDRNELHLIAHGRQVDHLLDLRDELAVQRAKILAAGIDEVEDDHLSLEGPELPGMSICILQREIGRGAVDRLEELFLALELRVELAQRMRLPRDRRAKHQSGNGQSDRDPGGTREQRRCELYQSHDSPCALLRATDRQHRGLRAWLRLEIATNDRGHLGTVPFGRTHFPGNLAAFAVDQ